MSPVAAIVAWLAVVLVAVWARERWWQWRHRSRASVIELAPRAVREPRSCMRVTPRVYDWQHEPPTT